MKTVWRRVLIVCLLFVPIFLTSYSGTFVSASAGAGPRPNGNAGYEGFLPLLLTVPQSGQHTFTLQQGLDGYSGVADTWVSSNDWDTPPQYSVNYGQNEALNLDRDGGDNPLLRFDLSSIPANSDVISATLYLYNSTGSCNDGACSTPHVRRVQLYRVLRDWDEGNQVASPIDAAGKNGATGDYAFRYYTGEGMDVAWGGRGMASGADYAATAESSADVVDAGWYAWDVSALVRAWVRGEQPNYGLVLRDATGWEEENSDWRSFHASQYGADPALRPKLVVTYNPDVPYADAGMDQEILQWDGTAITLDGSASHDRPGGNDSTLTTTWRILTPAYDSAQSGVIGNAAVITFTPDVAGEWDFQLTVSNDLGENASDSVHVRLLRIPAGHPRIFLTPTRLAALRARATADNIRWTQLKAAADAGDGMLQEALVAQVSGDTSYCTPALAEAQQHVDADQDCSSCPGDIALVYDWCYDQMTAAQRDDFITYFNHRGDNPSYGNFPGWGNYWPRHGYSYALMGLATYGDNPRAEEWLNAYRYDHVRDNDTAILNQIAAGGGWPEGMVYDWIANVFRVKATAAWESATGERLFASTPWYRERLGYLLLHQWPGTAQEWGRQYHPYPSTGDSERNRGTMANYGRIMALILVDRFLDASFAPQLQAYLATAPDDNSDSFLYHDEFLWFDPDLPTATPSLRTHYAAGTGTIFMRSGWPSGAADTDTSATYLTFQAGDHFTYHQHYDQNSFTLFKHVDLALDSGVYSGDGLSHHDKNYYVRSIAHNTLVVYNPDENFEAARPDTTSNDGGQRSMYPANRAPETVDTFDQHRAQYDTGDMLRFEDAALYTYALGDATKAYNNPAYNQAMAANSAYSGSVAKVSRFQRELVYLRPVAGDSSKRDYVVLLDRVGVTEPRFSGANTKLLFHFFAEPTVNGTGTAISAGETLYTDGDLITADNGSGRLFVKSLLPAGVHLRKVGGRGQKAFWVFDANYDWQWSAGEAQPRPTNDFEDVPYGEWRVEMEPPDTALDHTFLTVLHPSDSSVAAMPATHLIQAEGGMTGVHIADGELDRVALFSAALDGSAPTGVIRYTITPTAEALNLLFDLTPNARYTLSTTNQGSSTIVTLTPAGGGTLQVSSQGVLSFTLPLGSGGTAPPTATPTSTTTPGATSTATATPTSTATATPTPTATLSGAVADVITFSRDNDRVYRIAAQANATPEDVSARLDALSAGSEDRLLNISPNGQWLVLETDRFGCSGWPCLAVVKADFSSGDAVRSGGNVIHPDGGISAVASGGDLLVYPDTSGPHSRDLYAIRRSNGVWGAPLLLTGASTYQINGHPAISADGSKVLFDCDNDIGDVGEAICEVHTDGTGFRVVLTPADGPGPRYNPLHSPDYAPDGSIVFEGDWDGETVWRLPVGSSTPVKVGSFANDNSPCVLPDGQIASLWMDRPGGPSVHELKVMSDSGHSYFMVLTGVDVFDVGLGCGGNAIPPEGFCVQDVNGNGVGDVLDILFAAGRPGCAPYLSTVVNRWRHPWPTPTP